MSVQKTRRSRLPIARRDGPGVAAVTDSGLPKLLASIDGGRFGTTTVNIAVLEGLARSLDLAVEAHEQAAFHLADPEEDHRLEPDHSRVAGMLAMLVFCRGARQAIERIVEPHDVEGALSPDGLSDLAALDPGDIATRLAGLAASFVRRERKAPRGEALASDEAAARCVHVFATLLERAVRDVSTRGRPGRIAQGLSSTVIEVGDERWKGLAPYAVAPARTAALRPVGPEDVVGNTEYMQAALRLARDVAGYDFQAGTNPKRLNPVLFALGRPGCGKTLVAHAVGNYFTRYCDERSIPSRFVVIRRSDWASSYQNASAANLIRIFREVHEFEGVSGIYWADIDTALATRGQSGMRSEEKANLSAAFNVFDGTLIPFDGKWFMLCDANNLDMDDALKSRIARNPFRVLGPETVADHVRLLRDILLADFLDLVGADDAEWEEIGRIALDGGISGRGLEGISRQIIDHIQDFEYPDAYYDADIEERRLIIRDCSNPVDAAFVRAALRNYLEFEKDEEERVARQRFDDAVADAVFGLEVQKEVFGRVSET